MLYLFDKLFTKLNSCFLLQYCFLDILETNDIKMTKTIKVITCSNHQLYEQILA